MENSHTPLAKFIHWTFTILYAYGIFKQVEDLEELDNVALLNFEIFFAIVFLIIVLLRFFYMKDVKTLLSANEEMHKGHLFIAKLTTFKIISSTFLQFKSKYYIAYHKTIKTFAVII